MVERKLSRRRFLTVIAAASPSVFAGSTLAFSNDVRSWNGTALGAESQMFFDGLSDRQTKNVIAQVLGEVERLEQVFSLYRADSELNQLNKTGVLRNPSHDMQILLTRALEFCRQTDGAFNPAIQPLWKMISTHFANSSIDEPSAEHIQQVLTRCDPAGIRIREGQINLHSGMALTFNGIAQGYITDQVTSLLHQTGLRHVLMNLGEMRALPGRGWDVRLGHGGKMRLAGRALATSEPAGTVLSPDGIWHHLINPATGNSAHDVRQVSVVARDATTADALSTALAVSSAPARALIAERFPDVGIRTITAEGSEERSGPLV